MKATVCKASDYCTNKWEVDGESIEEILQKLEEESKEKKYANDHRYIIDLSEKLEIIIYDFYIE